MGIADIFRLKIVLVHLTLPQERKGSEILQTDNHDGTSDDGFLGKIKQ